jgi:hypothetical protein
MIISVGPILSAQYQASTGYYIENVIVPNSRPNQPQYHPNQDPHHATVLTFSSGYILLQDGTK